MKDIVLINGRKIGFNHLPLFIAEAGINHNGEMSIAKELIDMASKVGVEVIKFQKRDFKNTITTEVLQRDYQHSNSFGKTYLEHKITLEFSNEELLELADYSQSKNLIFTCSAFDIKSYDFVEKELNPPFHKIPSPLTVNHDLLLHIASYGKPLFISTGMTSGEEIDIMMDVLKEYMDNIVLLQCTSLYPTKNEEVNLNIIKTFQQKYNVISGFSSHDQSVVFPSVAVALGARVIEKHITLDRAMKGPDHASSFEERGLELSYRYCSDVFSAMGSYQKQVLEREQESRTKHLQSIVSANDIEKGTILEQKHLVYKSPGNGILPYNKKEVLGKRTLSMIPKDTTIQLEDLK
jgi:sialic acid synthase SpsE